MPDPNNPPSSAGDPLDAIIAEYVQQVEAGGVPNREDMLAQHPELAERLRAFFADFDRLDRQAAELRLFTDPNRTTDESGPTGDLPRVRYFGDYELLEVIARGGMGVVYKARQVSLNRVVALKMVLRGELATERDVARFRSEAESAANLDHPNIVPIYEVGEHDGQQYYSMRYVEGASLARRPRSDPRSEAQLVGVIAGAVHHAHRRGVLHRDIKPSNILVDASGAPLVADFGLAKRVDANLSLTETGAIVGTPRYMAPEQAAGRKDLTVAVDVYSLGVVLYERLTGSTPFPGDNVLELLRQAREEEPIRPSSFCPGLDRDLETICLKCLEKDAAKRYASAEALQDDLERWLEGRPIQARPVGRTERFGRWCRRNPAVASLTAGVVLLLLSATVISTRLAVWALGERDRADARTRDVEEAGEQLERTLARSLARLLRDDDKDIRYIQQQPMKSPEIEALWELAQSSSDHLRTSFVIEAIGDPLSAGQLRNRSSPALIAALGLDPNRREWAAQALSDRMNDGTLSLRHRSAVACVALELADDESSVAHQAEDLIIRAIADGINSPQDIALRDWLVDHGNGVHPAPAARMLAKLLEKEASFQARHSLAFWLAAVARRLPPADAVAVCAPAARQLAEKMSVVLQMDAWGLAAVASCLPPADAARILAAALAKARNANVHVAHQSLNLQVQWSLAVALAGVAERLPPADAAAVCAPAARQLAEALAKATDADARRHLALGLAAVAERLPLGDAATVCTPAIRQLADALAKATNAGGRYQLAEGLAAMVKRLPSADAAAVCVPVARQLAKETGAIDSWEPARVLATTTDWLPADEAARTLAKALAKATDTSALVMLAERLAAVAGRLPQDAPAAVCAPAARQLAEAVMKKSDDEVGSLARGLAEVVRRLPPADAAGLVFEVLPKVDNAKARQELIHSLMSVTDHLESLEAEKVRNQALGELQRLEANAGIWEEPMSYKSAISWVVQSLADEKAHSIALRQCSQFMAAQEPEAQTLDRFLTEATPIHRSRRAAATTTAISLAFGGPLPALSALPVASEPLPCRLSTAELVELLKYPTCFGEARKVVLKHLGNRYGRVFANHWQFVRFAQEQHLNLDLTSPPKRWRGRR